MAKNSKYWSDYFKTNPITRRAYSFLRAMNDGLFNGAVAHGCRTARTLRRIYPEASPEIIAVALLHQLLELMDIKDLVSILAQILPDKVAYCLLILHSLDFDFDDILDNYRPKQKRSDALAEEQELYNDILEYSSIDLLALKLAHRIECLNDTRSMVFKFYAKGESISSANFQRLKLFLSNTHRFNVPIAKVLGRRAKIVLYRSVYQWSTIKQDADVALEQKRKPRTMYMTV